MKTFSAILSIVIGITLQATANSDQPEFFCGADGQFARNAKSVASSIESLQSKGLSGADVIFFRSQLSQYIETSSKICSNQYESSAANDCLRMKLAEHNFRGTVEQLRASGSSETIINSMQQSLNDLTAKVQNVCAD